MLPATTVHLNCDLQRSVRVRECACVFGGAGDGVEECVRARVRICV